jgi:hypothetical protein
MLIKKRGNPGIIKRNPIESGKSTQVEKNEKDNRKPPKLEKKACKSQINQKEYKKNTLQITDMM